MGPRLLALALAADSLAGCSSSLDSCVAERIDLTWPATITRDGAPVAVTLAGQVSPSNIDVPVFATLRAVLTGEVGAETAGVVWTVPAFEPEQGWVAVAIDAPVAVGETLTVGSTFNGGGWGAYDLPDGVRAAAGFRVGTLAAGEVIGTVEVLAVDPLRLRLDLTGRSGGTVLARVQGDAAFSYQAGPPSCT
jgi:hypothetical protein